MSKRIPFNIKYRPQIESGEYKVETRDGKHVRILCYDANNNVPIVALVTFNDGSEGACHYYSDGAISCEETPLDLFIVTPEPDLTEFEQELVNFFKERNAILPDKDGVYNKHDCEEFLHKSASKLLAIAREELADESVQREDEVEHDAWYRGYNQGKAEALKDLPRWKECDGYWDGTYVTLKGANPVLIVHGKILSLEDLMKLPGFKED